MTSIVYGLIGGVLIGLSAILLMAFNGRIAGISGIVGGLFGGFGEEFEWRGALVAGLLVGGAIMYLVAPQNFGVPPEHISTPGVIAAGLCVGFGTRLGSGCTSGHGICGLSRLSGRSLVAVVSFIISGAVTVALLH